MQKPVTLKFMDGHEENGLLARPFRQRENEVDLTLARDGTRQTFGLSEICCIVFHGEGGWSLAPQEGEGVEEIDTFTGDHFTVKIHGEDKEKPGFFGTPAEPETSWQSIFFTRQGVRTRRQQRLLGDILTANGLVSPEMIDEVLKEQGELRSRRIGEIIALYNDLSQESIEESIREAERTQKLPANARVGDILIAAGLVTREQVEQALANQEEGRKMKVGELLVARGLVTEAQLLSALATKFKLSFIDLEEVFPTPEALGALSKGTVHRLQVLPIEIYEKTLTVATGSPTDPTIGDSLRFISNFNIDFIVARPQQIEEAIQKYYGESDDPVESLILEMARDGEVLEGEEEVPSTDETDSQVITLVNRILLEAANKGASDIHFEPAMGTGGIKIRYRIDGTCRTTHNLSAAFKKPVISRLKIMAALDVAEHRRPQSGKILLRKAGKRIEYRVEITPTVGEQEDAVLRILSASRPLPLGSLGFSSDNYQRFLGILGKPYGIILCVGPTGSGKTTTLHSALGQINTSERKIWTVEDPVEITQPGLRQVQVNPKIGFSFPEALRSFLRSDPDVIMIGEMRDVETAKTAIGGSLTGHLVLSTLHTNNAPETLTRLIEMGMDKVNFSDALLAVLAQRLALRLCEHCRVSYHPDRDEYDRLVEAYDPKLFEKHGMPTFSEDLVLMKKGSCKACDETGYRGRLAIHELLVNSDALREGIKRDHHTEALRATALHEGMRTLRMDGVAKVFAGLTDLEQILRVCL